MIDQCFLYVRGEAWRSILTSSHTSSPFLPNAALVLSTINNLAMVYVDSGRLTEACALLEKCVLLKRRNLGHHTPQHTEEYY